MAKTGKIIRLFEWRRGMKFQSGCKRGDRFIDVILVDGQHYLCRLSHRASYKKSPQGEKFSHYWRVMPVEKYIAKKVFASKRKVGDIELSVKELSYGE